MMRHTSPSTPVLLGGENRSGTTLLSVILDSHPQLDVGPELDFVEPRNLGTEVVEACDLLINGDMRVLGKGTDTSDPYYYHAAHFVKQCHRYGIEPVALRAIVVGQIEGDGRDIVGLDDRCRLVDRVGSTKLEKSAKKVWGIKLQRKIADIDLYSRFWPFAKFIHIIRDGRDLVASHLKTVPEWGFTSIDTAAFSWQQVVEAARLRAPAERYKEVRYEDLITQPIETCKSMCTFLGVQFDEVMLRHETLSHSLHENTWSHPSAATTSRPISQSPIGRFRKDLTHREIEQFESIAGATLIRHGYRLDERHA